MDKYLFYDENNEPVEFILEGKFEINETPYVAMLPAKDLKGDIYILRIDKDMDGNEAVSYTHLTLPTIRHRCRSRWSPYH